MKAILRTNGVRLIPESLIESQTLEAWSRWAEVCKCHTLNPRRSDISFDNLGKNIVEVDLWIRPGVEELLYEASDIKRAQRDKEDAEILAAVLRIAAENADCMVPDPAGTYPRCKPDASGHCVRCSNLLRATAGAACPSIPEDKRWRFQNP